MVLTWARGRYLPPSWNTFGSPVWSMLGLIRQVTTCWLNRSVLPYSRCSKHAPPIPTTASADTTRKLLFTDSSIFFLLHILFSQCFPCNNPDDSPPLQSTHELLPNERASTVDRAHAKTSRTSPTRRTTGISPREDQQLKSKRIQFRRDPILGG